MKSIRWFHEIDSGDLELVGGKGANLGEMVKAQFPVPPGFCLTAQAYRDVVKSTDLSQKIQELIDRTDMGDPQDVERKAESIRKHITQVSLPPEMAEEIVKCYSLLASEMGTTGESNIPVAVRSSATAEDLPGASFAGQQDTYLNIRGKQELLEHVKRCWASLWTARAIIYRNKQNFDHLKVYLSVVIQAMVPSEISGIMFTADPVSGDRDVVVINASWGLGEAIVSGLVSPDMISVRKSTGEVLSQHISTKEKYIEYAPDGGIVELETPPEKRQIPALSNQLTRELAALGTKIEDYYCAPQDIEWAFVDGLLYVLQSRPITTLEKYGPVSNEQAEYNRTMFLEIFPDPLSPSFYSVIQPLFHSMLEFTFKAWGFKPSEEMQAVGIFYNQPYFNCGYIEDALSPLSSSVRELLVSQIVNPFGDHKEGPQGEISLPYIRMAWRTLRFLLDFPKRLPDILLDYHTEVVQVSKLPVGKLSDTELVCTVKNLVYGSSERLLNYDFLLIAVIKRVYQLLGKLLTPYFGEEAVAIRGKLISGVTGNATMNTNIHLWNLAQFAKSSPEVCEQLRRSSGDELINNLENFSEGQDFLAELEKFLNAFGHREVRLDIIYPTWCEDPSPVLNFVRGYIEIGEDQDPQRQQKRLVKQREEVKELVRLRLARDLKGRFIIWPLFDLLLKKIDFHARERDTMHFEMTRLFPPFRRIFSELGERWRENALIENPDDIYFLTLDEMQSLADNPMVKIELVKSRREEYEINKSRPWPDIICGGQEIYSSQPVSIENTDQQLKGIAGSPGVASGRARVIQGPEEFHRIKEGDILVAPITNPAWTPLFAIASGIVTEVGGILSHGAIVAREYGIPAVMSIPAATKHVTDGTSITVNGDTGLVYLQMELV